MKMRKITAIVLSLILLLGCVSSLADEGTISMVGWFSLETNKIPAGYTIKTIKNNELEYEGYMQSSDADKPHYYLLINFNDQFTGVNTLDDVSAEEKKQIKQEYYDVLEYEDGDLVFEDKKTSDGIPVLTVLAKDGALCSAYMIYLGYEIEIDGYPGGSNTEAGIALTEADARMMVGILSNMKKPAIETPEQTDPEDPEEEEPEESIHISKAKISTIPDQIYTGKSIKPALTVTYDGKTLTEGTDYSVKWKNNKNPGKATVTIKGKGNNKGEKTAIFKILPKPVELSSLKAGKKSLTAKWKKGS